MAIQLHRFDIRHISDNVTKQQLLQMLLDEGYKKAFGLFQTYVYTRFEAEGEYYQIGWRFRHGFFQPNRLFIVVEIDFFAANYQFNEQTLKSMVAKITRQI